jgi:hypothetical protein
MAAVFAARGESDFVNPADLPGYSKKNTLNAKKYVAIPVCFAIGEFTITFAKCSGQFIFSVCCHFYIATGQAYTSLLLFSVFLISICRRLISASSGCVFPKPLS